MANSIQTAIQKLQAGEIVGLPTETVYGLAVDAADAMAVNALHQLKGRPDGKPFQVMVQSVEEAAKLCMFDARAEKLAARFWPGPLTIVLTSLQKDRTIGIRIPDHAVIMELLKIYGRPIAVTSANYAGEPSAKDAAEAKRIFDGAISCYVDGPSGEGRASTVIDLTREKLVLLREGALELEKIEAALAACGKVN